MLHSRRFLLPTTTTTATNYYYKTNVATKFNFNTNQHPIIFTPRYLTTTNKPTPVTLPTLPYSYKDLEPVLASELMELHHSKHHQAYVTNYNAAVEKFHTLEQQGDVAGMIALQPALRFNGGGHVNHSIFWQNLSPPGKGGQPDSNLSSAINTRWGSLANFKTEMSTKAVAVQGSGWAWLALDPSTKGLTIVTCANQDPCSTTGTIPLLGIDVWEHGYYLSYKNNRAAYVNKLLETCINWSDVSKRYADASGKKA
jgi:Fe-Mn family superoxide dismutase